MPMFPRFPSLLVSAVLLPLAAVSAFAGEITGERIFDRGSPRVDKTDKVVASAEAAADAELQQAQVRHLRMQVRNWARAADSLAAEEAAAMRDGDSAGVAAVALRRKSVAAKLEALKAKLAEETG